MASCSTKQLADSRLALSMAAHNPLANMQPLKANLPAAAQAVIDLNGRPTYSNNPLIVLPSGQTVPLSACYGQHQNSSGDQAAQMPYIPTGMFPNFLGNTNLGPGAMTNYNWPYGLPGDAPGLDPARRGSWSSEDNGPITPVVGPAAHSDFYNNGSFPYMPQASATMTQQYIAGPIQP